MKGSRAQQLIAILVAIPFVFTAWAVASGEGNPGGVPGLSADASATALGTAFTYQGQLKLNDAFLDDICDFRFELWDSPTDATGQVGSTVTRTNVNVVAGHFVIPSLDFGVNAFSGQARWLEVEVRCPSGSGVYSKLSPRQPLTPAPYSLYASHAPWTGLSGVPAGFADGVDNNTTYTAGAGLTLSGGKFSVSFAGSGAATTVARSDHHHWGQTWSGDNWGLFLDADAPTYANATALVATSRTSAGSGVQGLVAPSGSSAGMLVPTAVSGISLVPAGGWSNKTFGVYGEAGGVGGYGLYGRGTYTGTFGVADSFSGRGVYGKAPDGTGVHGKGVNGAVGESTVDNGTGVLGQANTGSLAFGVWGISAQGYAGYFSGKVHVTGALSKSSGGFLIDHPLDPANQYLSHSFVESPDMKNIYDGVTTLDGNGEATITLPDWFEALNRDFRYQLTCVGGYAPVYISQEISNGAFRIAGGTPGLKVSWQVTGIRQDPWANDNRVEVETPKAAEEAGTYLYPQGYGLPDSAALNYEREQALGVQSSSEARSQAPVTMENYWLSTPDHKPAYPGYLIPPPE